MFSLVRSRCNWFFFSIWVQRYYQQQQQRRKHIETFQSIIIKFLSFFVVKFFHDKKCNLFSLVHASIHSIITARALFPTTCQFHLGTMKNTNFSLSKATKCENYQITIIICRIDGAQCTQNSFWAHFLLLSARWNKKLLTFWEQ